MNKRPQNLPGSQEKWGGTGKMGMGRVGWDFGVKFPGKLWLLHPWKCPKEKSGIGKGAGGEWDPNHPGIPQFPDFPCFFTFLDGVLLNPSLKWLE